MINTPIRDLWDMDDRALLQAIALSLNPRLQTAATAPSEADTAPGTGYSFAGRTAGGGYGDDV